MSVLGIDPGKGGGLVLVAGGGIECWAMPTVPTGKGSGREYDEPELARIIREARPGLVVIERQQAMPAIRGREQGAASTFSTGVGYGLIRGIVTALGLSREVVPPRTWQAKMLAGTAGDTKARAAERCRSLWPLVDWRASPKCRKPHEGIVDAALIALYGARYLTGLGYETESGDGG